MTFDSTIKQLRVLIGTEKFIREMTSRYYGIEFLPPAEGVAELSKHEHIARLVPENILCVNFQPWGLFESNYKKIFEKSSMFVTREYPSGPMTSLSFCTCVRVRRYLRIRADFYAVQELMNADLVITHILKHITDMVGRYPETAEVSYSMLFPAQIEKRGICRVVRYDLQLPLLTTPETDGLILEFPIVGGKTARI